MIMMVTMGMKNSKTSGMFSLRRPRFSTLLCGKTGHLEVDVEQALLML